MTAQPASLPAPADALRQTLLTDRARALGQLYRQGYPALRRHVRGRGGSEQDAQDVFQDALVVLYERAAAGTLTLTAAPGAWLLGVGRHLWQQEQRRRARLPHEPLPDTLPELADEADGAGAADRAGAVRERLARLGTKCRELLLGFYYFGQPLSQLAGEFGYRSVRSVTVQKFKCLERLRAAVRAPLAEEKTYA